MKTDEIHKVKERVFVVVVTYNGKHWYDRCFGSLRKSEVPLSVIVVDNASSDDTVEFIKTNFPEIILIKSEVNLGFGQGNNKGIKYALEHQADYIFLLNQDAWIEPETISGLIKIHSENPEYGLLSPMQLNADKTAIESSFLHKLVSKDITDAKLLNDLYFRKLNDVYTTKYVNAAAWLLPKNTLNKIGGFDPIFFHYGEDDNYLSRVIYHQMKVGVCPKLIISHDAERKVERTPKQKQNWSKIFLHEMTDLNRNINVNLMILFLLRKVIGNALTFQLKKVTYRYKQLKILLSNYNNINKSRSVNSTTGRLWL